MRKLFFMCFMLVFTTSLHAQDYRRTFAGVGEIIAKAETGVTITVKIAGSSDKTYTLIPFTNEEFKAAIVNSGIGFGDTIINSIFIDIVAFFITNNDEPEAGKLKVNSNVKMYCDEIRTSEWKNIKTIFTFAKPDTLKPIPITIKVENVQLEFEEGFLTNIVLEATYDSKRLFFTNPVSIGFASKKNITRLSGYELRLVNPMELFGVDVERPIKVHLAELLQYYNYSLRSMTRDYSPKNGVISITPSEEPTSLKKEATQKLFEASVYSDFLGFNQENPNGLVQTQISKRINTNTYRYWAFKKSNNVLTKSYRFIFGEGFGALQYVRPSVTLSKFEENNRHLVVNNEIKKDTIRIGGLLRDTLTLNKYLTGLQLLQYQNFSAGIDANLFYFENMPGKFNITCDVGMHFGRTALRDSIREFNQAKKQYIVTKNVREFGVNTLQLAGELKMQWYPDERYGLSLTRRWNYMTILGSSPDIDKVGQYEMANQKVKLEYLDKNGTWISSWHIEAFVMPDKERQNKLFFKYTLNGVLGNQKLNFQQAQVGYSFYLLRARSRDESKKAIN